jgi:hypothetical protein
MNLISYNKHKDGSIYKFNEEFNVLKILEK